MFTNRKVFHFSKQELRVFVDRQKTQVRIPVVPELPNASSIDLRGVKYPGSIGVFYQNSKELQSRLPIEWAPHFPLDVISLKEAIYCEDRTWKYAFDQQPIHIPLKNKKLVEKWGETHLKSKYHEFHAPHWSVRHKICILSVKIEPLHSISEQDLALEGFISSFIQKKYTARYYFQKHWDARWETWDLNPWVWVYTFKPL